MIDYANIKSKSYIFAVILTLLAHNIWAQNSAPSSHMVFDDNFDGDIIINKVRVPKDGEAMCTYYECLGWGGAGAGYSGIQAHPKAHVYIFSIWDNKKHTSPIKAVFTGPGTEIKPFGGEGTGLKSWNFELGWSKDVWYTFIARCWPSDDNTFYGLWVQAGDTEKWTHLVTMDVSAPNGSFSGRTDAFIEDWVDSGSNQRTINLRGGWKRKLDGSWYPFKECEYSVNKRDLVEGKRSYNFRENWNGGTSKDATGPFYYMVTGGNETRSEVQNPSKHAIEFIDKNLGYPTIKITKLSAENTDGSILIRWETDNATLPQFAYKIQLFDNRTGKGNALVSMTERKADSQAVTLDASSINLSGKTYYLHLQCIDILDGVSKTKITEIGIRNTALSERPHRLSSLSKIIHS